MRSLSDSDLPNMQQEKPPLHPFPGASYLKTEPGAGAEVLGGEMTTIPVDEPAGSYALLCYINDFQAQEVYVAAQLDVTGTPSYGVTTP
jgi:hypothetical protein